MPDRVEPVAAAAFSPETTWMMIKAIVLEQSDALCSSEQVLTPCLALGLRSV